MIDHDALIRRLALAARGAAQALASATTVTKAAALRGAAAALRDDTSAILDANAADMAEAAANGLHAAMLDRLNLNGSRLEAIATALECIAALPDPVGQVIDRTTRPNGLALSRVRVPLGVIGIVYESRPNVTVDAAALALMAGNATILRGGSEAARSNRALHATFVRGVAGAGLPEEAVQLVPSQDRGLVGAMLAAAGLIDVIIPRGGKGLVARVQAEARVPVLAHLDGNNHLYIGADADIPMAIALAVNGKMRRPGVCGATETVLIDARFGDPAGVIAALIDAGCSVRGDAAIAALDPRVAAATSQDWDTEYLAPVVAIASVDGPGAAIAHIVAHGSGHTDAIVTGDATVAEAFLGKVDSAIVLWNASTQFADGGEFGLGAEIGIATGRLHARGPVALEGLTTYKWIGRGSGQVRP